MAIFEEKKKDKSSYIVLLDSTGEDVVAYVNPVKTVPQELLVKTLISKGLKAEVRESADEVLELKL